MAVLLTTAFSAQAAGLGKLSVYSGIGQQLNAEVALSATPAELGSMTAKLASHEAFREAGIEYMPLLSDLRISVEKNSAGQPVLKLTTVRPISEPFLHFLVELSWTSGRMVREYTFLLDPPEMLQVAKPASVVAPSAPAIKTLPPAAAPVPSKPVAAAPEKPAPAPGDYRVRQGDTLGKIARETRSETVTLDQMLVALFNGNQDAFVGNNMNRLRAGKILRVPSPAEASQVDAAEARKLVISHAGEFNAYRNRLAAAAAAAAAPETAPQQQVSGTIKPQVEDKVSAPAAKDKLEVSRTEPAKIAQAAAGSSLEEDLIARDKALREASERIALLENNIENLKKLVEIKSQAGVKLQQGNEAVQPKPAEKPAEPVKAEAPVASPVAPVATSEPAPKPDDAKPAEEPPKPAESSAPPPVAKKPATAPPPPPPEPSFIDENPELVYGGGGLIALLLGYLGYSSWRRKMAEAGGSAIEAAPVFTPATGAPEAKPAIPGAPATPFDTGEISIQGEFSEGGLLTNEEIVDPVAEADVLMAYGRDRQAEEILQEGLIKDPSRPAIHMKLLELYAKQENIAQFEMVAEKLHTVNSGRGADWEKTLAVARTLGLSGGIFGAAAAVAEIVQPLPDSVEPAVTGAPLEEAEAASALAMPQAVGLVEAPAGEEVPSLEFDLDLGTSAGTEVAAAVAAAEQAAAVPVTENDMSLDFDFDLGTPEAEQAVEAVVERAVAPVEANLAEMDFDLDLGSPVEPDDETSAAVAQQVESAPHEAPSTGGIGELKLDFDLELDQALASTAAAEPVVEETDLVLDFSVAEEPELEAMAAATVAAEPVVEETDLVLDFPAAEEPAPETPVAAGKPDNPEVATKLELAQAYEEMGDLEGARELLNEVVSEGSEAQQAQARAKLDQLGIA